MSESTLTNTLQQVVSNPFVEDSYPLSPLQAGMLFHSLDTSISGVDVEQIVCTFSEDLDLACLREAWQRVVERHAVLRTRFVLDGAGEPRQEVCSETTLSFATLDWHDCAANEQEIRWERLLVDDRSSGFDLTQLPLMRLKLVTLGERQFRLLWTFHHILMDGRSFPIVLRDVFTFYAALRAGQAIELPPVRPHKDFIDWLGKQDFGSAERYWRNHLKGLHAPPSINLPRGIAPTIELERRQGVVETRLSSGSANTLRAFAGEHGLTVNTLLQGAWALLLHHYTRSDDVIFGATRACRHSALNGAHDMVGLLINTLPLRARIDSQASLLPWLRDLRDQQLALRAYEHTPLVKVQEWSEVLAGTPLFESLLVFENRSLDGVMSAESNGWQHRHFEHRGQTNYPLTVIAYNDQCLLLRLEYDRARYCDDGCQRMLRHLQNLLEGMIGAPERKLSDVPLLTHEEKQELTTSFGQSTNRYARGDCLHESFEAQVERTPSNIAVSCEGQHLSYRELNERANLLAHRLRAAGVGPDVLVGLCAERSLALIVAMLAILKAGGAYLPLDPKYPAERSQFMLEDAQATVLLVQPGLENFHSVSSVTTLLIEQDDTAVSSPSTGEQNNLASGATPDNLAYVIYTSGPTGKPKGVLVTHRNVARLFQATEAQFGFDSKDVWTLFHSYAFDFSVWEIWGALLHGGKLVVVPHEVSRSPEEFAGLIRKHGVTVLNQTPSAFRQLIDPMIAQVRSAEMPLRAVIFGGEALEFQSLQPWFDYYGDERPHLVNMYGITETTVHVTHRRVVKADLNAGSSSIIGKAIADLNIRLLNQYRQLVPIAVPGEIHVGGGGVARGYLRREALTAERFIADPFSTDPQAKLYRSGDLARWLPNGDLEYLGRIDQQVKIRGFRIELGEIEAVLQQQCEVKEAAVIARQDKPGDKRLVGYFVADRDIGSEELRDRLRAHLPEHMIPAAFVRLERLPLTANGKLDRQALPPPDPLRTELCQDYRPPRSEDEATLCEIWRTVLGVSRVGIDDNFFELGGDSILSIQVISKARQAGLKLATRDLFKRPTIAALAVTAESTATVTAEHMHASGAVLLTLIQHWFVEQELAEQHHWNQAFFFETPADIDVEILEAALQQVVAQHDSLRLRFEKNASGWEQNYSTHVDRVAIHRKDLRSLSSIAQETALTQLAESLQTSLDISAGPIVCAAHIRPGHECAGRLLVIVHHLVIDGVSWHILMEDWETAYLALRANQQPTFPGRTSSYQKWSASLRDYAQSEVVAAEVDYWRSVASRATAELPIDHTTAASSGDSATKTVTMRLSADDTRRLLQAAPRSLRAPINEILLGALATAFAGWIASDSLLVDLEGHGRDELVADADVSRTIGWFTAISPVRLELPAAGALAESLRRAKRLLRAQPRHGIGYGALRYLCNDENVRRELASLPQARVAFNYLGQVDQWLAHSTLFRFAKESTGSWHSAKAQPRYQFEIVCAVQDGCFEVRWIFCEHLHQRATVEALAGKFLTALRSALELSAGAGESVLVPEDFPLADVDQPWLDRLVSQHGAVEDLYPLTPMQRLFYAMDGVSGKLGFEQWHYILRGPLNKTAFRKAWERVVAHHAVLRSGFVTFDLPEPLQYVLANASIPWLDADWRADPPAKQEEKLVALLREDREVGLNLAAAPLLRLSLIRTAEETHYFIWTTHHLLIDGWSWPLVFQELSAEYSAVCGGASENLPYACQFRDYVHWLQCQAAGSSENFWREELKGITQPTRFGLHRNAVPGASASNAFCEESGRLSESTMASLQTLARSHRLTLNTLVLAAWAMLLSRRSGAQDVIFGAALSGRPAELRGIEAMVGPCVNNLPIRVQVDRSAPLCDFLAAVQQKQFAASEHQCCSPEEIQRWSEVPARHRLFESLLVFQNYLVGTGTQRLGADIVVQPVAVPETTNYPLTLMVTPARDLRIKILFRDAEYSKENIRRLLGELQLVLEAMCANPQYSVGELVAELPELAPEYTTPRRDNVPPLRSDAQVLLATDLELSIAAVWQSLFQLEAVDPEANFFDLGGHSVLMVQAHKRLCEVLGRDLPIVKMFQYPTIRAMAKFLEGEPGGKPILDQARERAQKQKFFFGKKSQGMRRPHGGL